MEKFLTAPTVVTSYSPAMAVKATKGNKTLAAASIAAVAGSGPMAGSIATLACGLARLAPLPSCVRA